jgi:ribonucleoside-diphosphate reductase alpha chain/ribonucleoside-diphosphate reductase subunit M1
MDRVKQDKTWSLFCPDQCPGLSDAYGDEFKELYETYEKEGKAMKTLKARELWFKILDAQMETGTPYILFKDAANKKSNQKNLGTIKSSNLCTEIIEYSSPDETAVCNLASISLGKFVAPKINYKKANVFSKSGCEFCVKAKALLKENNIFYEETILDNEKERKSFYQEVSGEEDVNVNSMPQIYLDDEYVGGYQNLEKLLTPVFNYDKLHEVTKVVTHNLNNIIDINFYPTDKTHKSNMLHRPIGIGVQGLADAFFMLDIPFHSQEAIEINKKIFETMYHAALEKSMELSIERRQNLSELYDYLLGNQGCEEIKEIKESKLYNKNIKFIKPEINEIYHKYKPTSDELFGNHERMNGHPRNKNHLGAYSSFENSPAHNGFLQFDMWNVTPSTRYDWNNLKEKIITNGMRNSLLIAPMPTASTSQILGNNECFEPVTSNIYTRRTLAGEFVMANKYLMCDLIKIGKWDENIKNNIIANKGSVQQLSFLSQHLKDKYKIVWEIPMKQLIDMSKDRGAFICQSQSLNLWVEDPDYKILTSMYFYAYQSGLKTGVYYLRRKPKHQAQQFTIEPDKKEDKKETDYEICEMCSA